MEIELLQTELFKTHPRHEQISFREEDHKYIYTDFHTEEQEVWTGVTTLIKKFQPKVDWDAVAFGVAKKRRNLGEVGITKEMVLAEWKKKGTDSAERGTFIHNEIEDWINTGTNEGGYAHVIDRLKELLEIHGLKPVMAEAIVYDETIKCASMIDILCERDNKLVIVDTKTMADGIKFKGHNGKKMLYPFHKHEDCDFTKFSIQVGIYERWLKRKYHCDTDGAYIFHTDGTSGQLHYVKKMDAELDEMYAILTEQTTEKAPWE